MVHTIKVLAWALVISTAVGVGACSKAPGLGESGSGAETSVKQGDVSNVSNAELQDLMAKGVTLVDIRLPEEWRQTGVIKGSKQLTLFGKNGSVAPDFLTELQKIVPANKPVALICRTGNRTRAGSAMLAQAGYSHVYNVTDGIMGWLKEGKPVVQP